MGLTRTYLDFIEKAIEDTFAGQSGLNMLELGDQIIDDRSMSMETGKAYFTRAGFNHVSVDLNGQNGAVVKDLRKPEQFTDWREQWHVVTNSGTTEHVEPIETQYECFQIIHDLLVVGGISIHLNPDIQERDLRFHWVNHCRYYYSEDFYNFLAKSCGYELLDNRAICGLRCAVVKKSDAPFTKDRAGLITRITERPIRFTPRKLVGRILRRVGL